MGIDLKEDEFDSVLDEDERQGLLIESVTTRQELDEYEQVNIQEAVIWSLSKTFTIDDILHEGFIRELHKKMLCDVWEWAGRFRRRMTNIGHTEWEQIPQLVRQLVDNCRFWIEDAAERPDEIALRLKVEMVAIHPFPDGNGRHSRLLADILMQHVFQEQPFTWSGNELAQKGPTRETYIKVLIQAQEGDLGPLMEFARN